MKDAQERMDRFAAVARKAEAALREVAFEARRGADEACREAGNCKDGERDVMLDFSADLRRMAGMYEQAAGKAGEAYGIGRALRCIIGGQVVRPRFGDK